jgi:glycosyltransferase involved in cell wall biosynthesis
VKIIVPTISIIVPIYNVEQYLLKCLDSILAQTYSDFELILVNDGSKDNSGRICEEFSHKDKRIKVFHKANGGVSSARNIGINIANGDYLAFVDPDDTLEPNMYETLIQAAEKYNVDIVVCPIRIINLLTNKISVSKIWKNVNYPINKREIETQLIPSIIVDKNYSMVSIFNKLYKRSIFDNPKIRFDEKKHHSEDARLNFTLISLINNLLYVDQPLYNYYIHKRDSLGQIFREDLYDYARDNKNFLINLCKKYRLENLINTVRNNYTNATFGYIQDVVVRNIRMEMKITILSSILKDKEFIEDLLLYKSTNLINFVIKYICIFKNEKLLINFIKMKNRISPYFNGKMNG